MESARMIGALCIMLLIIVTGLALSRLTDHSPFFTAGALVILINAPNLWDTSLFAMMLSAEFELVGMVTDGRAMVDARSGSAPPATSSSSPRPTSWCGRSAWRLTAARS